MSFTEKLNGAMGKLEDAADELTGKAKQKLDESLTPENREKYKQKFDQAMNSADEELTRLGNNVGAELKDLFGKKS